MTDTNLDEMPTVEIEQFMQNRATSVSIHHQGETFVDAREDPERVTISRPRVRGGRDCATLAFRVEVGIPYETGELRTEAWQMKRRMLYLRYGIDIADRVDEDLDLEELDHLYNHVDGHPSDGNAGDTEDSGGGTLDDSTEEDGHD